MCLCKFCKATSLEYKGKCDNCGRWNCLIEVKGGVDKRFSTGIGEFDRVCGTSEGISGLVYPGLVLLAGPPGIGKSTLLLKAAKNVAEHVDHVVYATWEEP